MELKETPENTTKYIIETTDKREVYLFTKNTNFLIALFEIKVNMWRKWKHQPENLTIDSLREEINRIMEESNITEEDLS